MYSIIFWQHRSRIFLFVFSCAGNVQNTNINNVNYVLTLTYSCLIYAKIRPNWELRDREKYLSTHFMKKSVYFNCLGRRSTFQDFLSFHIGLYTEPDFSPLYFLKVTVWVTQNQRERACSSIFACLIVVGKELPNKYRSSYKGHREKFFDHKL